MIWEGNIAGRGFARIEILDAALGKVEILRQELSGAEYITPGFLDLQLNGYGGVDFSDPYLVPEQAWSVVAPLRKSGAAGFCPTLVTNTREAFLRNLKVLEQARRASPAFAQAAVCYHLEGPYFKPIGACGVHSIELMRPPPTGMSSVFFRKRQVKISES